MGAGNYSDDFKRNGVHQITVRGYPVWEVSRRLGWQYAFSVQLDEAVQRTVSPRLASLAGIAAQVGYRRRPGRSGGKPAIGAENRLEQQFQAPARDQIWVTDITYIKTHSGWLYLCVVIGLLSRRVVGWSAQPVAHDYGSASAGPADGRLATKARQEGHGAFRSRLSIHQPGMADVPASAQLEPSMSRRGNRHGTAVAESFFQLLTRKRNRRRAYPTREDARRDVFEYIELFYNPKRKHTSNGMLSPVDVETRQQKLNEAGVQETSGTSNEAFNKPLPDLNDYGRDYPGVTQGDGWSGEPPRGGRCHVLDPVCDATVALQTGGMQTHGGRKHDLMINFCRPFLQ